VALGHPNGLQVTVIDHDHVSAANVGRSRFFSSDVGAAKAASIVTRVNACYGLSFRALNTQVTKESGGWSVFGDADLVIGCVDTRDSRRNILAAMSEATGRRRYGRKSSYWLDLGNGNSDGQCVLGEVGNPDGMRLPCVTDLFPELLTSESDPVDPGPSCSMEEALTRQSAFVNKAASMHGVTMLATLFGRGELEYSAVFFNLVNGRTTTVPCEPEAWERFGYTKEKAMQQSRPDEELIDA
jgi:PRTRC genetic system ThiF family protein